MRGLYAIIDAESLETHNLETYPFAQAILAAEPAAVQLRDKRRNSGAYLEQLEAVLSLCRDAKVPLYANDRADLAALAGCDGVHVGQADMRPTDVRAVASDLAIGMSVHNDEELDIALAEAPDYIAFGPVFGTVSKKNPEPTIGLAGAARLAERIRKAGPLPRVAIGGIDASRVASLRGHCEMFAVISELLSDDDRPYEGATRRARALQRAWENG